jgi:hypothetical protein
LYIRFVGMETKQVAMLKGRLWWRGDLFTYLCIRVLVMMGKQTCKTDKTYLLYFKNSLRDRSCLNKRETVLAYCLLFGCQVRIITVGGNLCKMRYICFPCNFTHHVAKRCYEENLARKTIIFWKYPQWNQTSARVWHRTLWLVFASGKTRMLFLFGIVMTCTVINLNTQRSRRLLSYSF